MQILQQMHAQYQSIRQLLMYSTIQSMPQTVLALQMQETFTDVLQTQLRTFLKKESQPLKAVLQPLLLLLVQLQFLIQSKHLLLTAVTL